MWCLQPSFGEAVTPGFLRSYGHGSDGGGSPLTTVQSTRCELVHTSRGGAWQIEFDTHSKTCRDRVAFVILGKFREGATLTDDVALLGQVVADQGGRAMLLKLPNKGGYIVSRDHSLDEYGERLSLHTSLPAAAEVNIPIIIVRHEAGEKIKNHYKKDSLSIFIAKQRNPSDVRVYKPSTGGTSEAAAGGGFFGGFRSAVGNAVSAVQSALGNKPPLSVKLAEALENSATFDGITAVIALPADSVSLDVDKVCESLLGRDEADYARTILTAYEVFILARNRRQNDQEAHACLSQL
jgi:hypothetical protein